MFPGAGEVPVDGIDQDCDGADGTYPTSDDADGDGYGASVECDDANPSIHPGAVEIWYDGVDQDCDGADDDQDGDGYVRASDCDDTDATAFPGADEVASDGVDQDCDGSDMYDAGDLGANALIVTEIMKKPQVAPESYGEWIELYNNSGHRLLLDGVTVTATSAGLSFTISGDVQVAAGGYAVLARDADPALNGGVTADFDYRSDLALDNDAETLTLTYGSTTLDTVSYDDATFYPDSSGTSMSLDSAHVSATSNDNGQYWCDGAASFGDGDLGTPGAANSTCSGLTDADSDGYVSAHDCNDASRSIHPGASETARDGVDSDCDGADYAAIGMRSGELVVSEVMQNPDIVADADGEWFEVYNSTTSTLNLYGLSVTDGAGVGFTVDLDVIVASHGYVVFAVDADPLNNGGLPVVDYDYPGSLFALANSTDTINLYNGSTLIDGVTYDGLGTSAGGFPDPTGASMILSSRSFNATSNDRGTSWCTSTSYIADDATHDLGTPGEANDGC